MSVPREDTKSSPRSFLDVVLRLHIFDENGAEHVVLVARDEGKQIAELIALECGYYLQESPQ